MADNDISGVLSRVASPPAGGIGGDARYPVAPPLGWNAPPLAPQDRDLMIKTINGEAGDQSPIAQAALAHVILNRVGVGGYGQGVSGVVNAPVKPGSQYHQFSMWNPPPLPGGNKGGEITPQDPNYASIGDIVDQVYGGAIPDPTYGATHYYGRMPGGRPPPWGPMLNQNVNKIGGQTFVGGAGGPGRIFPQDVASGGAFGA